MKKVGKKKLKVMGAEISKIGNAGGKGLSKKGSK